MQDAMYGLSCKNSMSKAWDDLTNVDLSVGNATAARALEME